VSVQRPPANLSTKERKSLIFSCANARPDPRAVQSSVSHAFVRRVATKDAVDGRSIDQPDPVVTISSGRNEVASRE
jgi:hypothetical protein